MEHIPEFIYLLSRHWVALMSGLVAIFIYFWCAIRKKDFKFKWYLGIAAAMIFYASFLAWRDDHRALISEQEKNTPRLSARVLGLVTSPGGPEDVSRIHTVIFAFVEIASLGMPTTVGDYRLKVILSDNQPVDAMLVPTGSITNKLYSGDGLDVPPLLMIPPKKLLYNKTAQDPIPKGGKRNGALIFDVESYAREKIYFPGNKMILYFKDVTGKEYSVEQKITGQESASFMPPPGWESNE